ncbi:MAG TPA: sulfatase-like hydrolase/transferase, partial [Anaerolineae bacterium]|nr:sulfatase-like hydrolase/transferase [Anaerolineae bacterium]
SIYYTDQVLAEIFQLFQERSENLLFIYTSDHGEWITPKQGGHANAHPFQEEYRVPLVFWASHPEDLAPIAQATQGRLVNIETLNLQIRFLVSLEPDPGISYRTQVLSLGPGRIHDYTELPYVEYHETP